MYKKFLLLLIAGLSLFVTPLSAQKARPTTGINFRLGFWNMGNQDQFLTYIEENGREYVSVAGAGGWMSFVSRTNDLWSFEFSLGAFGKAEGETFNHWQEDVNATAVIPVLFGMQRDLLNINNSSDLRPYVAFGAGPYWITDVSEHRLNREVVVSTVDLGGYAGAGLNFFLGRKFAINFDARYHVVDFDTNNEISGLELGVGFSFLWGHYISNAKN